ncbi:MFS transporter [Paenibacillus hodogayensis]|uniref:MFS transporter n=1 Tax=Paenibacillus hodogayensis TaxID=279208 RepID=A0ABV5VTV2_9BACL
MKTAIWLYLFMFVAFFDLHAQYPILTPFAISLGAAPTFIGWMMGMYSLTHLPGNLLAGYWVDRYGSKLFICLSLLFAGVLLLYQAKVADPWHLLLIRSISGFVLAFLSPACLAMLAKLGSNRIQQGKLMAGNGFVHTLASVVSPAAGALLVAKVGFALAFSLLGWALIGIGASALFFIRDLPKPKRAVASDGLSGHHHHGHGMKAPAVLTDNPAAGGIPWLFYGVPLGLACSQGILFFELPLMKASQQSLLTSGLLFSMVSLGALCTLSLLFLHKYSPFSRTVFGAFALAMAFFGLAVDWPLPLMFSLLLIGMAKGIVFPAMATLLASVSSASRYGRVFSFMAISSSLGAFIGPVVAGQLRHSLSPYFIAFIILMLALTLLVPGKFRTAGDVPPVVE